MEAKSMVVKVTVKRAIREEIERRAQGMSIPMSEVVFRAFDNFLSGYIELDPVPSSVDLSLRLKPNEVKALQDEAKKRKVKFTTLLSRVIEKYIKETT